MRFRCGPSLRERFERWSDRREKWHRRFAWYPIRMKDETGAEICVWMERYETKRRFEYNAYSAWFEWDYRLINRNKRST